MTVVTPSKTGQQNGRLHLRRSYGRRIGDSRWMGGSGDGQGQFSPFAFEMRAHLGQRLDNALHGPFAQRSVAVETRRKIVSSDKADKQTRRRAAVPDIQSLSRRLQAIGADACDMPNVRCVFANLRAHRAERGNRGQHVFALQKAAHGRRAFRKGAQYDAAMGNAFVSGRRDIARKGFAAGRGKFLRLGHEIEPNTSKERFGIPLEFP